MAFEKELKELEVKVIHSSAYHPQSQELVERSIQTLKVYTPLIARKMAKKGSAISRFMGRATRNSIPNSWQHSIDWRKQIELRVEEIEKRVKKKEHTVEKKQFRVMI